MIYLDGFNRPLQEIQVHASPDGYSDWVISRLCAHLHCLWQSRPAGVEPRWGGTRWQFEPLELFSVWLARPCGGNRRTGAVASAEPWRTSACGKQGRELSSFRNAHGLAIHGLRQLSVRVFSVPGHRWLLRKPRRAGKCPAVVAYFHNPFCLWQSRAETRPAFAERPRRGWHTSLRGAAVVVSILSSMTVYCLFINDLTQIGH